MLWDLNEGSHLYHLPAGGVITALEFSPSKYCFALQLNLEQSESGISNPEPLSLIFPTSSLLHLLESESLDVLLLHGVLMVVLCMLVMQITSSEFGNSETKQTFYKKNKFKP